MSEARALLRHAVATVAYRGGKTVRGVSSEFGSFTLGDSPRTPARILAHIGDLFDWALSLARGRQVWVDSMPLAWDLEVARFHATIQRFDEYLASEEPLSATPEKLFQGPVADALTHVGQLAMLRRLAGVNMKSENYFQADIIAGRVGSGQSIPRREFD